jgi:hypothetical protein
MKTAINIKRTNAITLNILLLASTTAVEDISIENVEFSEYLLFRANIYILDVL